VKKQIVILAAFVAASTSAFAQTGGFSNSQTATAAPASGGFSGPGARSTTVQNALTMSDDSLATLQGNIVKHIGGDHYEFRDGSGSMNVEIDKDHWFGQTITPNDKVELQGEIDKDWNRVELDVKSLRKIN